MDTNKTKFKIANCYISFGLAAITIVGSLKIQELHSIIVGDAVTDKLNVAISAIALIVIITALTRISLNVRAASTYRLCVTAQRCIYTAASFQCMLDIFNLYSILSLKSADLYIYAITIVARIAIAFIVIHKTMLAKVQSSQ